MHRSQISIGTILIASSALLLGCRIGGDQTDSTRKKKDLAEKQPGTAITILLDYSASFAPWTANDVTALRATLDALAEKATRDWAGTTQIVLRKIGTSSVLSAPICPPIIHEAKLVGEGDDADSFSRQMAACLDASQRTHTDTAAGDRYTDISGAIALSAQASESLPGQKLLIIFSDFFEQQEPTTVPTAVHLHGENVLLVHRPGLDDRTIEEHVSRVRVWKDHLQGSGANSVAVIPEYWLTSGVIRRAVDGTSGGTAVLVLEQSHTLLNVAQAERQDRLVVLAQALGELSGKWRPPVTFLWYVSSSPSARLNWMPPLEYQPQLIERRGELNSLEALQAVLKETAAGSQHLLSSGPKPEPPLGSIIGLTRAPDVSLNRHLCIFIVSDLLESTAPELRDVELKNATVWLIYTPAASDRADPNRLFDRIKRWKDLLARKGAENVCAFELSSLVSSQLKSCQQSGTSQ